MRILELLTESLGGFKVKNHLTYLPIGQWIKQELGNKDQETDEAIGLNAPHQRVSDPEIQDYLKRVKSKEKDKSDYFVRPHVHASSLKFQDNGTDIDLDSVRKIITQRPKAILKQNEKMQHSDGSGEVYYNIGLPALKGLAVDEDTGEFVYVDTCPGAGSCQKICYVKGGSYIMFKGPWESMSRMLNYLLNDPKGFENQMSAEIKAAQAEFAPKGYKVNIRWHDAGDFFSPEYMAVAFDMARRFPDVKFYAYTKMGSAATASRPPNFEINWSEGAKGSERKVVKIHQDTTGQKLKHSTIVPKEMFRGMLVKDANKQWQWAPAQEVAFKEKMADTYKIDVSTILTYNEMVKTPIGDKPKWNVIVKPGEGDTSANRKDVLGTYLLYH